MVEEYAYDIFGKPYSINEEGKITKLKKSPVGNTRLYTGREYDRGLKLYYNRARYYDPKLARFISRDPIDITDDVNLYAYVGNNSVMFVDLNGLEKALIFAAKDKEFLGAEFPAISKAARLQYNILLNQGYKKENIDWVSGSTLDDFIGNIKSKDYKNISIVAHANSSAIDLDGTVTGDNNKIITSDTLSKLPDNLGEDVLLTLIACHSGNGDNSIAEQISEHMNIKVIAPTKYITAGKEYFVDQGQNKVTGFFVAQYYRTIQEEAQFLTFNP